MWALWLEKVNWENVAGFLVVIGMLGGILKYTIRLISMVNDLPDYISLQQRLSMDLRTTRADVKALKDERKSFRQEVLGKIEALDESVAHVTNDLSDLKNILLDK